MKKRIWKKKYNATMNSRLHFRTSQAVEKLWSSYKKYPKLQGISVDSWIKCISFKRCWSYIKKTRNIPKWVGYNVLFNRRKHD